MLTELALVSCATLGAMVFAATLARWALRLSSGEVEARRVAGAAARASEAFLWRQNRRIALLVAASCAALAALHGYRIAQGTAELKMAAWTLVALAAGALLCCGVAFFATQLALRAATRTAAAARVSLDHATAVGVRSSGVVGLVADAMSVIAIAAVLGLYYLFEGGPALSADVLGAALGRAALVLPAVGVGAAIAAMVLHCGGTAYYVAGRVGGALAGEKDAGLEAGDPRNPAMVAGLVGEHVGVASGRAVDTFVTGTLGNVVATMIGIAAFRAGGALGGLVTLPLVVRALGIVASAFGIMTARAAEAEGAAPALLRGHVTAALISAGAVAGASLWLLTDRYWLPFVTAALALSLISHGVAHSARYWLGRTLSPVRQVLETTRAGPAVTVARALGHGFCGIWPAVLGLGLALALCWQLGAGSGLGASEPGGLFAMGLALSSALSIGGYVCMLGVLSPIASTARRIRAMDRKNPDLDDRRRLTALEDAATGTASIAQTFLLTVGGATAVVAATSLPTTAIHEAKTLQLGLTMQEPAVLWSGVLGAVVVLLFCGRALGTAAQAARGGVLEVERQLRGFPRQGGLAQLPESYTPSYRAMIDQTQRLSADRLLVSAALVIAAPALLGIGLRLQYSSESLVAEALASFVIIASATGLATALALDGARSVLGAAHRANRPRGTSAGFDVSLTGHAFGDLIGSSAAPAAHLAIAASALVALTIAPLLN